VETIQPLRLECAPATSGVHHVVQGAAGQEMASNEAGERRALNGDTTRTSAGAGRAALREPKEDDGALAIGANDDEAAAAAAVELRGRRRQHP
jgi:hypothetical protein